MPRLLDTMSGFEAFARKAALETPYIRESLWRDKYEAAFPEVFEGFYASSGSPTGRAAIVRQLSQLRERIEEAAPSVRRSIEEVEAKLPELLDRPAEPSPLHVLMVGTLTTNAAVGRVGDDVAVFHCLEWFQSPESTAVLVAHETTHAWHELALGIKPPEDDAAWMAFSEGVAIQASRELMPGRPEEDYFWYGHPDVETWLPWCIERRHDLLDHFRAALDVPDTVETYFGGGTIDSQWRVGFYLADELVRTLNRPLSELVAMDVAQGQAAIRQVLGSDDPEHRPPSAH